jgi:alpha-mannosidase
VWSLTADARRLDLEVELDWFENQRLLKLAFPVAVHATAATYEVQWGQLVRPTHRNTPWDEARFEVCAHRWLDLSEPGFGVSLLNDGRYGHDVRRLPDGRGSVLRLSLLRAPLWPDPEVDRGRHELRVAIVPHDGEVWVARAEAAALNMPRRVVPLPARPGPLPATGTLVTADTPNVQVAAVKPAEDGPGTTAVRLFETVGSRTRVTLDGRLVAGRWCRADLLERPLGEWSTGPVTLELGPFEIATLLLAQGRSGGGARRAQGDPDLGWGGQAVVHRAV